MESGASDLVRAVWEDKADEVTALLAKGLNIDSKSVDGDNPLEVATNSGNIPMMIHLVENGADCNIPDTDGWYPLHAAVRLGSMDMIELLLKYGANVNVENENHTSPLCLAVRYGSPEMVSLFVQAGAKIDVTSTNGWTPLHLAARYNSLEVVQILVENGADISQLTEEGWSVLHFAAQYNNMEMVKYMVDTGIDITVKGANNATALHLASLEGSPDMVDLLLSLGANVDACDNNKYNAIMHAVFQKNLEKISLILKRKCNLEQKNIQGWTVLHIAAAYGSPEIVKLLLDSGARKVINEFDSKGNTALHHAIESGTIDTVKLLLDYDEDINKKGPIGWTLVHHAACYGDCEKLEALIVKGADLNPRPIDKSSTPLHVAAIYGTPDMIKLMLDQGANVNVADAEGFAPIHSAARFGHAETLWLMLDHGAEVNPLTQSKWTPLHLAVGNGDLDMVNMLADRGADLNAQKNDGMTALHIGLKDCTAIMVHLLLSLGANANIADNNGCYPLHLALLYGTNDVVDLILQQNVDTVKENNEGFNPLQIAIQGRNVGNVKKILILQNDDNAIKEALEYAIRQDCTSDILNVIDEAFLTTQENKRWDLNKLLLLYSTVTTISTEGSALQNVDEFNQTMLHYAAKKGISSHIIIFLENGADMHQADSCGTTPLQLITAYPHILPLVINHLGNEYKFDEEFYEYSKWFACLPMTDHMVNEILSVETAETWQPSEIPELPVPERVAKWLSRNEVSSDESHQEFELVQEGVDILVNTILTLMTKSDPDMKAEPVLIGSLSEGTKCGYPDQFDYLCHMERFSNNFILPKDIEVGLDLKSQDLNTLSKYNDKDGNLHVSTMIQGFNNALENILKDRSLMAEKLPSGFILETQDCINSKMPQIKLLWSGQEFKRLRITIDLQPAVKIEIPEDKIRGLPFDIDDITCYAVPIATGNGVYSNVFQLSLAETETKLFKYIQNDIRLGYILAKTFLTPRVCPSLDVKILDKATKAEEYIFTYLLKTCLLYELVEAKGEGEPIEKIDGYDIGTIPERILVWADRIYARLEFFLEQGYLPSYYTPEYDLLFGQVVMQGNEIASKLRNNNRISQTRHITYAYCDLIRNKLINA